MATDLYQGWDHRWLGTATMTVTDSVGASVVSITTGSYCHLSLAAVTPDARGASAIDTGFDDFATALAAAINALATDTITVAWSTPSLAYTIANASTSTLSISFSGAAGDRMRRILGFTANRSAAATYTSNMRPWYVCRAEIDGRSAYTFPTAREGQIRSAFGDDASLYTLSPTTLVQSAKWEHRFEQPSHVHRRKADADTVAGGVSWTWQDWMDHAARYAVPCVVRDSSGSMVFRTSVPFEANSARRRKPDADPQQIVAINAQAIVGYL